MRRVRAARGRLERLWRRTVAGLPVPDVALAAALCVIAVLSVLTGNPDEGPIAVTAPVAVLSTAALAWRVRAPLVCVGVLIGTGMVQALLAQPTGSLWSLVVYAIGMYSLAAHCSEGRAAIAGAVFTAALLVQERLGSGVDYLFIVLLFGGIWLLGRASRHWRLRVSSAERRQRDAARLAAAQERVHIARELHDVVAHSLSVIAVQSDAARALLGRQPERARAPLEAIGSTARQALSEMRSVLDILRTDDEAAMPPSRLAGIDRLAENARVAGLDVEIAVDDEAASLPASVDLTVYRIVQEGLTNVLRHAPGAHVDVTVATEPGRVTVTVCNGPGGRPDHATPVGGLGLLGADERVRRLGGVLSADGTAEGGFRLRAVLPLPRPDARGTS
ncbi:sensor histidine kinase [Microbacterium luticocti]|uniref:sensor histidine kinase n=1 Tax=Microbacterium luticocti TaxID=451764 RepID=UPI0003F91944|nr:sensor histidine kinase [Microbacterium luticocti]